MIPHTNMGGGSARASAVAALKPPARVHPRHQLRVSCVLGSKCAKLEQMCEMREMRELRGGGKRAKSPSPENPHILPTQANKP